MGNQFSDLSIPDPNKKYYVDSNNRCTGFSHLMKLVLCVRYFTDAENRIKRLLIDFPSEINKKNELGWSALMLASAYSENFSNNNVVRMLISANADINANNNNDYTALMYAVRYYSKCSSIDTVKILINAGANINYQNNRGNTAFLLYVMNTKIDDEMTRILLDANADINIVDRNDCTALMHAVDTPDKNQLVKTLIDNNANINFRGTSGGNALLMATYFNNNTSIIKMLLDAGTNIDFNDVQNETILINYIINNNNDTIDKELLILLTKKYRRYITSCEFDITDKKTPYDYYIEANYDILDEYFLKILKGEISLSNTKSANNNKY